MATGGASQLADLAGVGVLHVPLLWVTLAVAGTVTLTGITRGERTRWDRNHRDTRSPTTSRLGQFTIPVGLAVIGIGLAGLPGPVALTAAVVAVALAWVLTLALTLTVAWPVLVSRPSLAAVNGVWFIAPAAFLADAAGVAALTGRAEVMVGPVVAPLGWLAVGACGVGVAMYGVLVVLAAVRVAVHRLAGSPGAAWWIVTGCGGLAADALAHTGRIAPVAGASAFGWTALACWGLASIVLVPVAAGSVRHLVGVRHLSARPAWPPAFSTAVYALGTAQVASWFSLPLTGLARVTAVETLIVWTASAAVRMHSLVGRTSRDSAQDRS